MLRDPKGCEHFHHGMFHGYDFDATMLRIGSMNMLLHGVENPDIRYRDSLAQEHASEEEGYSLILANPPFQGSLDYESVAKDLLAVVRTKKTELLFLALLIKLLKPGGRAAVIVPDGVLFDSTSAHQTLRRTLVEDHKLEAVIAMPSGVFKPYAGLSTAILVFNKTNSGGTDHVWFYNMLADGWSLDDRRIALLPQAKLGPVADGGLTENEHERNNLPDLLARWTQRSTGERDRARSEQSFCVAREEIAARGYDLAFNRYAATKRKNRVAIDPADALDELLQLQARIQSPNGPLSGTGCRRRWRTSASASVRLWSFVNWRASRPRRLRRCSGLLRRPCACRSAKRA